MKFIIIYTLLQISLKEIISQPTTPTLPALPQASLPSNDTQLPSTSPSFCSGTTIIDVSALITPCQNFVTMRSSASSVSEMVVDYAKQETDISKLIMYAQIDIVYVGCMQLIADYSDVQEFLNQSGASSPTTSSPTKSPATTTTTPPTTSPTTPPTIPPTTPPTQPTTTPSSPKLSTTPPLPTVEPTTAVQ